MSDVKELNLKVKADVDSVKKATDEINKGVNDMTTSLKSKVSKGMETIGSSVKGIGTACAGVVGSVGALTGSITAMATKASDLVSDIDDNSQKLGVSTTYYQEMSYAMKLCGTDVENLKGGMKTLITQVDKAASGNKDASQTFQQLGIDIYDTNGKLKSQEQLLDETIMAMADMENGTEKNRLAVELFGKAGSELVPLLSQGSSAIKGLKQEAHDMGAVISEESISAGTNLGDMIDKFKSSATNLGAKLAASVMPIVSKVLQLILDNMPKITALFEKLEPVISQTLDKLLPPLIDMASSILPILIELLEQILPIVCDVLAGVLPIITNLLTALLPTILEITKSVLPLLLDIISKLFPILEIVIKLLSPIIELFNALITPILELVSSCITPLVDVISQFIQMALESLMPVIESVAESFRTAFSSIIPLISEIVKTLFPIFLELFKAILPIFESVISLLAPIISLFASLIEPIVQLIAVSLTPLIKIFEVFISLAVSVLIPVIQKLASVFSDKLAVGIEGIKPIINGLKQFFQGLIDFITGVFTGNWESAWQGIVNSFSGIWSSLAALIKFPVNQVIDMINGMICCINAISVDIPDWVPGVGGQHFGLSIPEIPHLAKGAVIRPNSEFLAVLGDQKSGLNIETPLDTMIQAFKTALNEGNYGGSSINLNIGNLVQDNRGMDWLAEQIQVALQRNGYLGRA